MPGAFSNQKETSEKDARYNLQWRPRLGRWSYELIKEAAAMRGNKLTHGEKVYAVRHAAHLRRDPDRGGLGDPASAEHEPGFVGGGERVD